MDLTSITEMTEVDPSKVIKSVPIMTDQLMAAVLFVGPNKDMPPHSHEEAHELHYVINGCGELNMDEETEQIYQGNLFLVPKGKTHHLRASDEGLVVLCVSPVTLPISLNDDVIKKKRSGKVDK